LVYFPKKKQETLIQRRFQREKTNDQIARSHKQQSQSFTRLVLLDYQPLPAQSHTPCEWNIFCWCMVCSRDGTRKPGANPTIVIYNASVVNFYNATGSLVRFENKKKYFILLWKML
jgi:hypothetical protein